MMKNLKLMYELVTFGAKPCGSFYVLGDKAHEHSDVDFYILESQVEKFEAKFLGDFRKENFTNYQDEFTVGLYVYEPPFDKDNMSLKMLEDNSDRIEVTVKKDQYADGINLMWSVLYSNPDIFKSHFWKKTGIPRDEIKERVKHMVLALN